MANSFLAVPLKRTWEVDLVKPLKTFISDTYRGKGREGKGKDPHCFLDKSNPVVTTVII